MRTPSGGGTNSPDRFQTWTPHAPNPDTCTSRSYTQHLLRTHLAHLPKTRKRCSALFKAVRNVQNQRLRVILGAFRATRIESLVCLWQMFRQFNSYLSARLASYRARAAASGIDWLIERYCRRSWAHWAERQEPTLPS